MTTELIPIESVNAPELFAGEALDNLIARIQAEARQYSFDMETMAGRKECASLAYKVARSKTAIDDAGKSLVEGWKKQAKVVDDARKRARETLDALRDEVRKPLDDWEAEQARIAKEEQDKEERRLENIENTLRHIRDVGDGMIGGQEQPFGILFRELDEKIIIDETFGERRDEAEAALQAARDKLLRAQDLQRREEEIAKKEADMRRKEEEAAQREREEAIRKEAAERAEREAKEAIERAEQQKAAAEQREREAAEKAKRDQEEAVRQAEERTRREAEERQQRQEAEAAQKRAEDERRAANKRRQASLKRKAAEALIDCLTDHEGNLQHQAEAVIEAIAAGNVPAVSIDFT